MVNLRFSLFVLIASLIFVQCKNKKETNPETSTQVTTDTKPDKPSRPDKAVDKLYPSDDAKLDPDFRKYRDDLLMNVESKNLSFLLQELDTNIDSGAAKGKDAFMDKWGLNTNPDQSKLWPLLTEILDNGGYFNQEKSIFIAPYYTNLPEEYDPEQYGVVVGKNVRFRGAPNRNAKLVGELTHDIVELVEQDQNAMVEERIGNETYYWEKIKTLDGREGFVYGKYLKNLDSYQVVFTKVQDAWKMVSFKGK